MARAHYIDNLRWMCILMLFPFHAAFIFCPGWYGYYVSAGSTSTAAHCLTVAVEPWIMPLLFCIAGMSTKFALQKRTPRAYLNERVIKLLVPFIAGLVLICPVIAYYALKFHAGYTGTVAGAFRHFFGSLSRVPQTNGIMGEFSADHLWFILFLFLFSVLLLGMILVGQRQEGIRLMPKDVNLPVLGLLFIPVWLLNFIGFAVTGYSLVSYFAIFLIGYSLVAMDSVQVTLEQYWAVLLAAWLVLTIGVMWIGGIFLGHSDVFWGSSPLYVFTGWTGVLALLGAGRHLVDWSTSVTTALGAASYPVYILHQAVLVAVAYEVLQLALWPLLQYAAVVILSFLLTFLLYGILRKITGIRVLFGIPSPLQNRA